MNDMVKLDENIIASLVTTGDLSRLSAAEKVAYYTYRCSQAGLDPAAKPFDLLRLNGKEILYANATCTQQLCANRKLSATIVKSEKMDDIYVVYSRVTDAEGRSTDNMGAVPLGGLKGDALSNAMMKATTKAIRRCVLAHCGLGMLDETETATIPGATAIPLPTLNAPMSHDEAVIILSDYGRSNGFTALVQECLGKVSDPNALREAARVIYKSIRESEKAAASGG
jgi:hypothetical protein